MAVTQHEREQIAAYVDGHAAESQRACDAHAPDPRACERAAALRGLAAYIRRLPLTDARLGDLSAFCCTDLQGRPLDGFLAGDRVAHALVGLDFDGAPSDFDAAVTKLIEFASQDRLDDVDYVATWVRAGGVVEAG